MATIINVLKLEEKMFPNSLRIFDQNVSKHMLFLITIPEENLLQNSEHVASAVLQENPLITIDINFIKVGGINLSVRLSFSEQPSKQIHRVTLYYMNSQYEVDLSETIEVPLISHKCQHFFKEHYQILRLFHSSRSQYYDVLDNKLINNNLHVLCKIEIKNVPSVKLDVLKSEQHTKLVSICREKLLPDFKIICQDTENLVHKAVLAHSSPVFQKMLETPMKESQTNEIKINNFQPDVVELMINSMYSDNEIQEDELSQETLKALFKAAHMYQLEGLRKICLKKMFKIAKDISEIMDVILFAGSEYKEEMVEFFKDVRYTLLLSD